MSDHRLMSILIFIICFLVNIILMLTILAGMSLLGKIGIMIIVDFAIQYLVYKSGIL